MYPALRILLASSLLLAACSSGAAPSDAPAPAVAPTTAAAPAPPAPTTGSPQPAPATTATGGPDEEASAAQILVAHAASEPRDPAVTRTRDEARARATELLARLQAGTAFDALARAESDHRSKARGGLIGTFKRADLPPAMAEGIYALAVGGVSPAPVETPAGFHLFHRLPVEKVRARHILVRYQGARNDHGATRSKADAERLARDLHARATAAGADFAALARENSEDGSAAQGGDLGEFGRGAMVPPFDEAVFRLTAGQVSDVVESEFGFHVILRY